MSDSIVFCSSQRFRKPLGFFIANFRQLLVSRDIFVEVLEPEFEARPEEFLNLTEAERLQNLAYRAGVAGAVFEHLCKKVIPAERCFIFNKDGYIGFNTAGELFAAFALGKICYALDDRTLVGDYTAGQLHEEPSARKLIHAIVSSPEELIKRFM
jgi:hypothetical protein